VPQQPSHTFLAGAALHAFGEALQPNASSSATSRPSGITAPESAPSAWGHLFGFNDPHHDTSGRAPLAAGALDADAAAAPPSPTPFNASEQLAAWLALANPDDIAQMISGGYAPPPGRPGLEALDAYGVSTDALLTQPPANGAGLGVHDPFAMMSQSPSDLA
jgi:hypothetical protein